MPPQHHLLLLLLILQQSSSSPPPSKYNALGWTLPLPSPSSSTALADLLLAHTNYAWCFTTPLTTTLTPPPIITLDSLALALSWPTIAAASNTTSNCIATIRVSSSTCGVGGSPSPTTLASTSARMIGFTPGTTALALVNSNGIPRWVNATNSDTTSFPAFPPLYYSLLPGSSYCVEISVSCPVLLAQVPRSRSYFSQYGFIGGPWLVHNDVAGSRSDSLWGLPASMLLISSSLNQTSSWNTTMAVARPLPLPPSPLPGVVVKSVLSPVGAPVASAALPQVLIGGIDGFLACFVSLDVSFAVRPYSVRLIPLAARAEDTAIASGPRVCSSTPPPPSIIPLQITTARIRQRGSDLTYKIVMQKTVNISLPRTDAEAVQISVDAQFSEYKNGFPSDIMRTSEGWCVGAGPAYGYSLRVASSDVPAGTWGPSLCTSTGFSCYGIANYAGTPATRNEPLSAAPWFSLDLQTTPNVLPDATETTTNNLSQGAVAAIVIFVLLFIAALIYAIITLRRRREGNVSTKLPDHEDFSTDQVVAIQ